MNPIKSVTTATEGRPNERWHRFREVVHGRRAIREFSAEPIARTDMEDVLDAALVAPTSSNLQPFELVWVRSAESRRALVRACLSQPAAKSAAELVVVLARWDRCEETRAELSAQVAAHGGASMERFYYEHLVRWAYDTGPFDLYGRARRALLSPWRLAVPMPRGPVTIADVRTWAVKSAALVCENLMLAARAKGLDSCPMEGVDPVRVGRVVGMAPRAWKRTWDVTMVIALGHRAPDARVVPRWRRARDTLVREV